MQTVAPNAPRPDTTPSLVDVAPPGALCTVSLCVNGQSRVITIDPRVTLLDALREYIGLTGTKKGCNHGQCGACTVHVNGQRVNSCLTLALMHTDATITTIEHLAHGENLHPLQSAFIRHDAFQCGYCTPGQIMSALGMFSEGHAHSDADVQELMSGNLCRCGAYNNIVAAIQEARTQFGDGANPIPRPNGTPPENAVPNGNDAAAPPEIYGPAGWEGASA